MRVNNLYKMVQFCKKKNVPQRSNPLPCNNLWHSSLVTLSIALGDPRPASVTAWQDTSTANHKK
jgi:hypothetical protein